MEKSKYRPNEKGEWKSVQMKDIKTSVFFFEPSEDKLLLHKVTKTTKTWQELPISD